MTLVAVWKLRLTIIQLLTPDDIERPWMLNFNLSSSHVHMDKIFQLNRLVCHGGSADVFRLWAIVPWWPLEVLEQVIIPFLGARGYLIQTPRTFPFISLFQRVALCGTCCICPPGCECIWLIRCHCHRSQPWVSGSHGMCLTFPISLEQGSLPHQQVNRRPSEQQWSAEFLHGIYAWPRGRNSLCPVQPLPSHPLVPDLALAAPGSRHGTPGVGKVVLWERFSDFGRPCWGMIAFSWRVLVIKQPTKTQNRF